MACIVALRDAGEKKLVFAGSEDADIWRVEKADRTWLVGIDGDRRYRQVCRYLMEWPEGDAAGIIPRNDAHENGILKYLVTGFLPALIDSLECQHLLLKEKEGGAGMKARLLVGTGERIFEIGSKFGIEEIIDPYGSIGECSGQALGSLATTAELHYTTDERLQIALKAAKAKGFTKLDAPYA